MVQAYSKLTGVANVSEQGEIIKRDLKSSEVCAGNKMRFKLEKCKLIYLEEIINSVVASSITEM